MVKDLIPIFLKLFPKIEVERPFPNLINEDNITLIQKPDKKTQKNTEETNKTNTHTEKRILGQIFSWTEIQKFSIKYQTIFDKIQHLLMITQ